MKELNIYKEQFSIAIDTCSSLLADYDNAVDTFQKSGGNLIIKHTNKAKETNAVKNPFYQAIEAMRSQTIKSLNELGLTPVGLKKINDKALEVKEKSSLAEALSKYGKK